MGCSCSCRFSGVRAWQYRYVLNGKAQTATLGKVTDAQGLGWARVKEAAAPAGARSIHDFTRTGSPEKALLLSAAAIPYAHASPTLTSTVAEELVRAKR